jgi:hypothetical protein
VYALSGGGTLSVSETDNGDGTKTAFINSGSGDLTFSVA